MANKITMDMELRFIDNATGEAKATSKAFDQIEKEAKEAGQQVDNLGKKKAKPAVDADVSRVDKKLSKIDSVLRKFGLKKTKVPLDADDKASAKITKLLNKAKNWAGRKYEAFVGLKDSKALNTLNNMSNKLRSFTSKTWETAIKLKDTFTKPLTTLKNMLFNVKTLIAGIASAWAAVKFVKEPIALADAYSSAKIGFSTLLGESQGQQMMNDLDAFAKATPFKSSEVISQTQRMLAMGWEAESIIDDMGTIGDAAAATGKGEQGLQQIVTALAQIKTKGKLSTEELNQLAEAGISAKKYIAEGLGYGSGDEGIAKMTKDLENGAISSGKALQALLSGMKEYQGMMDKTANETVEGLWSQIQDTFEINILRRWGQGLQDGAKRGFGSIVELLNEADGALEEFGDTVYEVGENVSDWLADKFENAVKRITEITGSFEFKNASLGEKISMLWNGVIVDPLEEWWEGGGQEKTAETAGKIGSWIGEMLTKGLLALFGATDVLDEGVGSEAGSSIAGSFVQGFMDNFDGSAITQAFVDAIGNVWGALPWWAKILIGGYGIGKAAGGIANFAGGVASFAGGVSNVVGGFNVASSAFPILTSTGSGILGTVGKAGVALGATTTGGALLAGSAGIAGGVAGGVALGKGIYDLYGAHKAYKAGDETEFNAKMASGLTTTSGVAMGAAVGAVFGPLGALVGAGIGGVAGWFMGGKAADDIRAAAYESEEMKKAIEDSDASAEELAQIFEKAKWESAKKHFGDIKLSLSEIQRLADQIVWGDDMGNYEKFTASTQAAETALQSLKTAAESSDRWMWKASLGVKFNDDEIESIKQSFDDYISSAKSFVENKHYEFTAAVSLLVDVKSEEGKSIIDSGNAFYGKLQKQLDNLGTELSNTLDTVLKDGVISTKDKVKIKIDGVEYELNEQEAITKLQAKIAEITEKVANAEQEAELQLIKVKFGNGNLDLDSFDTFMAQMETTLNERIAANDEAFKASVASLNLQLEEGAITEEEYNKQLQTLVDGYTGKVESLKAEILGVELEIIGEAYQEELGEDAAADLNKVLQYAIENNIDPVEIKADKLFELLNVDSLSEETEANIREMLSGVFGQVELIEVDGKLLLDLGIETEEDPVEKVEETIPDNVESVVGVDISGEKNILNKIDVVQDDFGVPEEHAATVAMLLYGDKDILNKIDVSQLAKEFGIPESQAKTIIEKLTGEKSIENKLKVLASDFGIPDVIHKTVQVKVKGTVTTTGNPKMDYASKQAQLYNQENGFRGGIFGGSSSLKSFARGGIAGFSNGGIVRGGSQLIEVAEEGSPEMVIPLSSQRRDRALKLWAKAGEMLGVNKYARGGRTDGGADEAIRSRYYGTSDSASSQTVEVNVNGVQVDVHVDATGSQSVAEAIKEQAADIADTLAGIFADALGAQFENTPVRGGN